MQRWRQSAERAAKLKGAKRACGLCKRGMMGLAKVSITVPWDSRTIRRRWLCTDCWKDVVWWLEEEEYTRDKFDAPIDMTARGITKGGGERGRQLGVASIR